MQTPTAAWILANEPWLRVGVFGVLLLLLLAVQDLWPRRGPDPRRRARWTANFSIVVLDVALVRLLIPLGAVGAAVWADVHGWGLFAQTAWRSVEFDSSGRARFLQN